jgi:hypothetical protein
MTNFLNLRCPRCGSGEHIDVAALVWLRVTGDGTDAEQARNHDHDYDANSGAVCAACEYGGRLGDFEPTPEPEAS